MTKGLERIRKIYGRGKPSSPFSELLGFRVTSVELGQAEIEIEMAENHLNNLGTIHGGVFCTIADTAMGVAFATMLDHGESMATLELKINFLRHVWKGKVLAIGKVVNMNGTTGFVECSVLNEDRQLVARASSTFLTISGDRTKNRALPA